MVTYQMVCGCGGSCCVAHPWDAAGEASKMAKPKVRLHCRRGKTCYHASDCVRSVHRIWILAMARWTNDFGSIMLEENVVSAAGAPHRFTYKSMQDAIREAGFEPQLRNQEYEWRELPAQIEEQVINY